MILLRAPKEKLVFGSRKASMSGPHTEPHGSTSKSMSILYEGGRLPQFHSNLCLSLIVLVRCLMANDFIILKPEIGDSSLTGDSALLSYFKFFIKKTVCSVFPRLKLLATVEGARNDWCASCLGEYNWKLVWFSYRKLWCTTRFWCITSGYLLPSLQADDTIQCSGWDEGRLTEVLNSCTYSLV